MNRAIALPLYPTGTKGSKSLSTVSLMCSCSSLRALSRRKNVEPRTQLQAADLVLDPATREVKRAGSVVPLTKTEFVLLEMLMRNAGRVITRSRMIETAWGHDRDVENNTLDVFIRQLRSKVDLPGSHKLIHTIRGIGYALREEEGA
jgi:DNA-binding response OmpR family regulator